jgi:hypothetical protein
VPLDTAAPKLPTVHVTGVSSPEKTRRRAAHFGHAQIGGRGADLCRAAAAVVELTGLADGIADIRTHDEEARLDCRRQGQRLTDRVALAVVERTLLGKVAEVPDLVGGRQVRIIAEIHRIDPGAAEAVAAVVYAVAEGVGVAGRRRCLADDFAEHQVGRRGAEDTDRPGVVVVVVDLVRIVGIEVRGERVFEDHVVGVAPDAEIVLAGDRRRREA